MDETLFTLKSFDEDGDRVAVGDPSEVTRRWGWVAQQRRCQECGAWTPDWPEFRCNHDPDVD